MGPKPLYIRYIDDIFGLSTMTEDDLRHFIDAFCNFHPAVEFTFDIAKKVNFLDISLSIESLVFPLQSIIKVLILNTPFTEFYPI